MASLSGPQIHPGRLVFLDDWSEYDMTRLRGWAEGRAPRRQQYQTERNKQKKKKKKQKQQNNNKKKRKTDLILSFLQRWRLAAEITKDQIDKPLRQH